MPELPEVETIKIQLNKFITGLKIVDVVFKNPKYFFETKNVIDSKVLMVRRFAKVTAIDLSSGFTILAHVKLTGQFIYQGPKLKTNLISKKVIGGLGGPHTHIIFKFDDLSQLFYNDVRRFGWVRLVKRSELENEKFLKQLGPEPKLASTNPEVKLTKEHFLKLVSSSKRNIKVLLMDQSKISGVGNIYANDALWLSHIDPKRQANSLSMDEACLLYQSIHDVLENGIKYGGASELAFVTPDGKEGEYQNHTLVYGRVNKDCLRCGRKIIKYFIGGRGTYVCSNCQK